jgi:hypothetical protein
MSGAEPEFAGDSCGLHNRPEPGNVITEYRRDLGYGPEYLLRVPHADERDDPRGNDRKMEERLPGVLGQLDLPAKTG